jgi:Major Facilitator Superfamily
LTQRSESSAVFTAGVVQGVALVTFPAASTILTSPQYYGLSHSAYGGIFLPQAVMAIVASLLGAGLSRRWTVKYVYLLGLLADFVSMALLLLSQYAIGHGPLAYVMLLAATAFLGAGFGLTVPSLNTLIAGFYPAMVGRALLVLNALLGVGTVLAPVLVAVFIGLGHWSGLPLVVAIAAAVLMMVSLGLPLKTGDEATAGSEAARNVIPSKFWIFAAFALLYGIVETMNGNWSSLYMVNHFGATAALASFSLTAFWGMVTVGRVLFASLDRAVPDRVTFHVLPFIAAIALAVLALLPKDAAAAGIAGFALAGLGCSALLPLTISFGQRDLTVMGALVAGGLIAFYQGGYGIAAFGVGPLEAVTGLGLTAMYGLTALVAVALGAVSFVVVAGKERGHAASGQASAGAGP